ncbi:DNA-binding pseudobarrel domain-containing protein [Tanacetum coccineum]
MARVDVDTLTMEQYLALSRENQAPGVVKPEIRGNVNFEIKSQFIHELREDTFSGNKDEDDHGHIDRVLSIVGLFNIPGVTKDAACSEFFPLLVQGSAKDAVDRLTLELSIYWVGSPQEGLYPQAWERTTNRQLLDSHRPIPEMRPAEALTAIQTMADHSKKWHDDTSRNIGPPGYYTKIDNRPPYAERRQSLEELLTKHQEESARRSTEMEIDQLTEELRSRKEKSKQAKVVTVENEGPSSPKQLKNLHGISFLFDSLEENINDQLPTNEANPGHFTLPCTIGNFNFYAMADLGASVDVLPRNIFEYLELTNLSITEMLVEMAYMRKKAPLGIVRDIIVKIDKFMFPSDFVI